MGPYYHRREGRLVCDWHTPVAASLVWIRKVDGQEEGDWLMRAPACQDLTWQLTRLSSGLTHPNLLLTEIPPGWRIIYHSPGPNFWWLVELCKCRVGGDKWSNGVQFLAACNSTSNPPLPMQQVSNWRSAVTTWYKLPLLALCLQIKGSFSPKNNVCLNSWGLWNPWKTLELNFKSWFLRQEKTFVPPSRLFHFKTFWPWCCKYSGLSASESIVPAPKSPFQPPPINLPC